MKRGRLQRPLSGSRSSGWAHTKTSGLYRRLEALSVAYQAERSGLETDGLTHLVVRALCHCAISAVSGGWSAGATSQEMLRFTVDEVKITVQELAIEDGLEDAETWLNNRKVGWVLSRLRFKRAPRPGGKGSRMWQISLDELQGVASAYGVSFPHIPAGHGSNGPDEATAQKGGEYAQIAKWVTGPRGDGISQ